MSMARALLLTIFSLVMLLDLFLPYLLAPFYRGYSHKTMVMSYLGNPKSPVRLFYNAWLVMGGAFFLLGAVAFSRALGGLYGTIMLVLLWFFGLGAMVLSGLFSVGETKEMKSLGEKIHGYGASLGFMALLLVPGLLGLLFWQRGDREATAICAGSFLLALVCFVLFVMADKEPFQNTLIGQEGTWQRLTLLFFYLPLIYLSLSRLLYT